MLCYRHVGSCIFVLFNTKNLCTLFQSPMVLKFRFLTNTARISVGNCSWVNRLCVCVIGEVVGYGGWWVSVVSERLYLFMAPIYLMSSLSIHWDRSPIDANILLNIQNCLYYKNKSWSHKSNTEVLDSDSSESIPVKRPELIYSFIRSLMSPLILM